MNVTNERVAALLNRFDPSISFLTEEFAGIVWIRKVVYANIDHGCARLDEIAANECRAAHCRDEYFCLPRY